MESALSDIQSRCAYCGKVITSEIENSNFFVGAGEEIDGTERIAVFQFVCLDCMKEKELDKIALDLMADAKQE